MPFPGEQTYQKLARLLVAPTVEPSQRAVRIQAVEKDVILPLRLLLIVILGGFFFMSHWSDVPDQPRGLGHTLFQYYFWVYLAANIAAGACFIGVREMSLKATQWINFTIGVLDVVLMTGLTFIVDGFDSPLYWLFLVLILHNALAIPLAFPQILLNLLGTLGFIVGGVLDKWLISGNSLDKESIAKGVHFVSGLIHNSNLEPGDPSYRIAHGKPLRARPRPRHLGRLLLWHPGPL